ncbi:MAG TPA: FAD/NAD(P)-binding protein, partial [Bryobacteraceae bacterium]|nr:FAD/NAD(P)-binding protein [Bryobacteraceae bacterium]
MSTRRQFVGFGLVGLSRKADRPITGGFVNDSYKLGHQIRDRSLASTPRQQVMIPVVIVGGGIAGLSAAWRFEKRGFQDYLLLEMEPQAGGNSRSGENEVTRYPWAAHYLPVPGSRSTLVRELMQDLGVLR